MTASELYQSVTHYFDQYLSFIVLIVTVVLAIILFLGRNKIRYVWLNIKTRYHLNRLGIKQITNFRCPDGLGGYFIIDRLLMLPDGIGLVMFKQYPGSIFCADNIEEWSQILDGKSYHFKNPLVDLDYQVNAVSACIPGVPVNGFIFFDHQADFPKGHPERVIQLDTIPQSLLWEKNTEAQKSVVSAWDSLCSGNHPSGPDPSKTTTF